MEEMKKKVDQMKKSGEGNPKIVLGLLEALLGSANGSNHLLKMKIHALSKEKKDISGKLETAENDLQEAREKNQEMKKRLVNETKMRRKDRAKLKKLRKEFDHFKTIYESRIHEWKTVLSTSPSSNLSASATASPGRAGEVQMPQSDNPMHRLRMIANAKRGASSTSASPMMPPPIPKKRFRGNMQNSGGEIET